MMSAIHDRQVEPGMVVLGDLTIQGNIKGLTSILEPLQVAVDNGASRALVPISNKAQFAALPEDVVEKLELVFYGEPDRAWRQKHSLHDVNCIYACPRRNTALFEDQQQATQVMDVFERVVLHHNQIRQLSHLDGTEVCPNATQRRGGVLSPPAGSATALPRP